MLKMKDIADKLGLKFLNTTEIDLNSIEIKGCYIGDLLSNVMAHAHEADLWLTVQTHQNVIAVAQLLNMGGVVFLEGHLPQEDTKIKADEHKIPLFSTEDSAYTLAGRLYKLGLNGRES